MLVAGAIVLLTLASVHSQSRDQPVRPRTIVTTDPELDDSNSLVRFLLYSAELETEGLITRAASSIGVATARDALLHARSRVFTRQRINLCPYASWRWKPGERYIDDAVEVYAKVYPNLRVHDLNYPTPEFLRWKIREGNVEFEGDTSKDTPGSDLIKRAPR